MPAELNLNDKALSLSPEFRYLHDQGDTVYAADDQGADGLTNERTVKPGDWIDSVDSVVVVTPGTARLLQFSHDEADPVAAKSKKKD